MGFVDWFRRAFGTPGIVEAMPENAGDQSPYLSVADAKDLLVADADGMPPLLLVPYRDEWWLSERTTGRLVNVAQRQLRGLGLWTCRLRGEQFSEGTLRIGEVQLLREPDNEYDSNAVAVGQDGVRVGYFNKAMAKGLAKALDGGEQVVALAISVNPPKVIAAPPALISHIRGAFPLH